MAVTRSHLVRTLAGFLLVGGVLVAPAPAAAQPAPFVERKLATLPAQFHGSALVAPGGIAATYTVPEGGGARYAVTDSMGPLAIGIHEMPTVSPDWRRIAYGGWVRPPDGLGEQHFAFDGAARREVAGPTRLYTWSPDSRHCAYVVPSGAQQQVVFADGQPRGPAGGWVATIVWSPDSKKLAYLTQGGTLVVDGKVLPHSVVGPPAFSPSGRLAYVRVDGDQRRMVVDGKDGPAVDDATPPVWSPDGKSVGYVALVDGQRFCIVGAKRTPAVAGKEIATHLPADHAKMPCAFASDGKTLIYVVREGTQVRVAIGGEAGPWFNRVHHARYPGVAGTEVIYVGEGDDGYHMVTGITSGPLIGNAGPIAFSPDARRTALRAGKQVAIDGVLGRRFNMVGAPVFSPDGTQIAYLAYPGDSRCVLVVGDRTIELPHIGIDPIAFSPDGKQVGYVHSAGDDIWWRVVNVAE